MVEPQAKRPRHWAEDLVDAWVRRQDPAPIVARIPELYRELALLHARLQYEKIQFWSRELAAGMPVDRLPRGMLAVCETYMNARGMKRTLPGFAF